MNRTLLICTALAATICAAGCGSSGAAKTAPATPQQRYIAALRHLKADHVDAPEVQDMTRDELLQVGRTVCTYLNHPAEHPYGPANDIVGKGYISNAVTALAISKEAKTYLCPTAPGTLS